MTLIAAPSESGRAIKAARRGEWRQGGELMIAVNMEAAYCLYWRESGRSGLADVGGERLRRAFGRRWMSEVMRMNRYNRFLAERMA
jgi:hypothetical protein